MSCMKRLAPQTPKSGRSHSGVSLPPFIAPQLKLVEAPPCGPQWPHKIKLDGYRMAARVDHGRVQLLTRTGLDWSDKISKRHGYARKPQREDRSYRRELCGVDAAGLPSLADPGGDRWRTRSPSDLLRLLPLASQRMGPLKLAAHKTQGTARANGHRQGGRSVQRP
jgi:hypothetical protein